MAAPTRIVDLAEQARNNALVSMMELVHRFDMREIDFEEFERRYKEQLAAYEKAGGELP